LPNISLSRRPDSKKVQMLVALESLHRHWHLNVKFLLLACPHNITCRRTPRTAASLVASFNLQALKACSSAQSTPVQVHGTAARLHRTPSPRPTTTGPESTRETRPSHLIPAYDYLPPSTLAKSSSWRTILARGERPCHPVGDFRAFTSPTRSNHPQSIWVAVRAFLLLRMLKRK